MKWISIPIFVAVVVCQFWTMPVDKVPNGCILIGDRCGYHIPAVNLSRGHGYKGYFIDSQDSYSVLYRSQEDYDTLPGRLTTIVPFYRPPGYPIFLAALYTVTYPSERMVYIAQTLMFGAMCAMLYLIGLGWFTWYVAMIPVLAMWADPTFTRFFPVALTEMFTAFLVVLVTLLLVKRWWVLAGIFSAWLVLTRPNFIFCVPIIAICLIKEKAFWRYAVAGLLTAMPWTVYASASCGKLMVAGAGGPYQFALGWTDSVLDKPAGDAKMRVEQRPQEWGTTKAEQSKYVLDRGWSVGASEMGNKFVAKVVAKIKWMWVRWPWVWLFVACVGLWRMCPWSLAFPLSLFITAVVFFGNPRFVVPVNPILYLGVVGAAFVRPDKQKLALMATGWRKK